MISIVIEDNGNVSLKTTKGVVETETAATIVIEAMRNLFKPKGDSATQTSYYLYLNKVEDNNKLSTVKSVSNMANIGLQKAKNIVDAVANGQKMLIIQSFDYSAITSACESLEAKGCTCEITSN